MAEYNVTEPDAPTLGVAVTGEIVTISIGPDKKSHRIHKDLICYYSEYFRTAYNGRWKESEDCVALNSVETEVFNVFVHWLYTQQLPTTQESLANIIGTVAGEFVSQKDIEFILIKARVFGDRFLALAFKRDTYNCFVTLKGSNPPWYEYVKYAFGNLPEDDLLLTFMVDMQCISWQPDSDDEEEVVHRVPLPPAFLVRVMIRNYELKETPMARQDIDLCSYHYHESDKEREACPQRKKLGVKS